MADKAPSAEGVPTAKACCYDPVEKLGTGGMGEVWKAKHGMLERPAAIKYIRPETVALGGEISARSVREQFEREAQATAALDSPHTIELYDFGVAEDGRFYYVMELLDGIDLQSLVEHHGPVSVNRAVHFLRQTCHSLAEAHATGLIHRDIKPANIYTCRRGLDHDYIKVLDFGLVRRIDQPDDMDIGLVAGTPAFMAPEIARGDQIIDGRADIYGLGCVAYWLVTGHLVFTGDVKAVMTQHVRETPKPPTHVAEIDIPDLFERVVLDCLQKNPQRRPQSAKELADRLLECEVAAGTWSQEQAEYWWTLHRPPVST